jgi:hypothetical protein
MIPKRAPLEKGRFSGPLNGPGLRRLEVLPTIVDTFTEPHRPIPNRLEP